MAAVLFAIAACFLLKFSHRANAINFSLADISSHDSNTTLILYGNASITGQQGIQLTKPGQSWNAGRAVYFDILHLWDQSTGEQAEFTTHFKFTIDSGGNKSFGDGFAFFLTPNDSLGSNIEPGAAFGLPARPPPFTEINPFVAVEFDAYYNNQWDPADANTTQTHVGVDVNSLKSVADKPWQSDIPGGAENEAWISYNPSSKIMSVNFTDHVNNATVQTGFKASIVLKDHLPEFVAIGFGASTGGLYEKHYVKSWQFNSSLMVVKQTTAPVPVTPGPPTSGSKTRAGGIGYLWVTCFGWLFLM